MTVEELDIIVNASIEPALKEIKKLMPQIKQQVTQAVEVAQKSMEQIDTKKMSNKINQAMTLVKNKIDNLKKSNKNNEIAVTINNKDAQKQISQLEKQIESLQDKITARRIKLGIITPKIDAIANEPMNRVNPERLNNNRQYINLSDKETQLTKEINYYSEKITEAKGKMSQLKEEIKQTATTQNKLSSFFSGFKNKIDQVKPSISGMKSQFSQMPKLTQNITNNIKSVSSGLKQGLSHILKYAGALFGLRSIYNVLRNSASTWLSSQNAGAQQLSANIEYMKYAMGSVFAPVIEYVINLVYQLMKAIQSLVYAFSGVNIFAKATASSMKSAAGSAKKAKEETKQLAGVHSDINNVQSNNNSGGGSGGGAGTPSFDLSQMENTPNSIMEAIKKGDWYQVGVLIGEKLNKAMESIPWDKIQNTARNIGKNIALTLNGFIATTDWKLIGNTIAQGLNTAVYLSQSFLRNFDFSSLGRAMGETINGFFKKVDWTALADTISAGIIGIFNIISGFFDTLDWNFVIDGLIEFVTNIDWSGIAISISEALASAIISFLKLGMVIGERINKGIDDAKKYFKDKIDECGGNIGEGILNGIKDIFKNIGQWIHDNIFQPFIDKFKEKFEIHSPSKVMEELGKMITEGLLNGIKTIPEKVKEKWEELKTNTKNKFLEIKDTVINKITETKTNVLNKITEMKDNVVNTFSNIKSRASEIWNNIKTDIISKVTGVKDGIKNKFQEAYNNITSIFGRLGNYFSGIWGNIRNTFSSLGTSIGSAISGAVKTGINNVISLVQNTINRAINLINGAIGVINAIPGVNISRINTLYLPRLAKGNVAYSPMVAQFGEYIGANSNPEITAPQNILRETFDDVLSDHEWNNQQSSNNGLDKLIIQFGSTQVALEIEKLLQQARRQNGTATVTI